MDSRRNGSDGNEGGRPGHSVAGAVAKSLACAAVAYSATCGFVALTLSRPKRIPFDETPDQYGLVFEPVSFRSRVDDIPLDGWLLSRSPNAPSHRPVIMVHGMGSDRQHEAGGAALRIAANLVRDGHPVLLFDLRGSGRSGGRHFTLGAEEVRDVGGAIDFLAERGLASKGVNLLGYSMGASIALLAGAVEPLVRAIAEDSGFADLDDLLEVHLPRMSHLPGFFTPGVVFAVRSLLGIDVHAIRPIEAAPRLAARGVPLLVLHGDSDALVPISHGHRLAAAYGPKAETLFVPGAEHVVSYATDPAGYLERLTDFFDHTE